MIVQTTSSEEHSHHSSSDVKLDLNGETQDVVAYESSTTRELGLGRGEREGITTLVQNWKCLLVCLLVAVSNFQYGFDTSIVNGFQAMQGFLRVFGVPGPNGQFVIQTTFQQLITSLLQVGLIVASVMMGPLSDVVGRRAGFIIASMVAFAGVTIQILVTTQKPLYVGRLLLGIANGFYVNLTVLYISETAPPHLRGLMVSIFQPFVNLGTFIGAVVSNALHNNLTKHSYQIQLALLYLVPVWLTLSVWFIPESPRWLVTRDRDEDAWRSLRRLRPSSTKDATVGAELSEIREAVRMEREYASKTAWKDIWKGTDLRRTLLTIACTTFHAASGINVIVGYSTFFFQIAGSAKPFTDSVIVQSVNLGASLVSLYLARHYGRRPLLLIGFTLSTISMLAIAVVYTISPTKHSSGQALVGLLCVLLGAYGATIGPMSWVTAGEMPSNHLRSWTFGVGMGVGFVFAWLTTFTTPFFINANALNWGAKVAWIWGPSNLIALVFIWFCLPETQGRKLEELDEIFYNRVPARKFKGYKCMASGEFTRGSPRT